MSKSTAAVYAGPSYDERVFSLGELRRAARAIGGALINGIGAIIAVGLLIVAVTLAAAWTVNSAMVTRPQFQAHDHVQALTGPRAVALATADFNRTVASDATFEAKWARAATSMPGVALLPEALRPVAVASNAAPAHSPAVRPGEVGRVAAPRSHPVRNELAPAEPDQAPPEVMAKATPVPNPLPKPALNREARATPPVAPPRPESRTAVYDIAAHTVYLPNGEKLEAHSGLGAKRDDPRYTKIRMRGPTPPNVYELTMREKLFHGVRAIRLNPVDEGKMHGRDGMLAHTYMLGPSGQSNGCVSFKDYRKFLQAFLDGKVDRLVVVPDLGGTDWRTAAREGGVGRKPGRRYAANRPDDERNAITR